MSLLVLLVAKELSFQALYLGEENQNTQASRLYEQALEEENLLWRRNVLHFNLGTLHLREERPEEALHEFSLAWSKSMPEYLKAPLRNNVSAAFTALGKENFVEAVESGKWNMGSLPKELPQEFDKPPLQTIAKGTASLTNALTLLQAMIFGKAAGLARNTDLEKSYLEEITAAYQALLPFPGELTKWERELFAEHHCLKTPFRKIVFLYDEALSIRHTSHARLVKEGHLNLEWEETTFMKEKLEELLALLEQAEEMEQSSPEEMREQTLDDRLVEMHWQDEQLEEKPVGDGEWVEKPW